MVHWWVHTQQDVHWKLHVFELKLLNIGVGCGWRDPVADEVVNLEEHHTGAKSKGKA